MVGLSIKVRVAVGSSSGVGHNKNRTVPSRNAAVTSSDFDRCQKVQERLWIDH